MLKIARHAGATLGRDGADATAILTLPPDDLGSHWSQMFETQASEIDYSLKLQAVRMDRLARNVRDHMPWRRPGRRLTPHVPADRGCAKRLAHRLAG